MTTNQATGLDAFSQHSVNALGSTLMALYFEPAEYESTDEADQGDSISEMRFENSLGDKINIQLLTQLHWHDGNVHFSSLDADLLISDSRRAAQNKLLELMVFISIRSPCGRPQISYVLLADLELYLKPKPNFADAFYVHLLEFDPLPVSHAMAQCANEYMAMHSAAVDLPF